MTYLSICSGIEAVSVTWEPTKEYLLNNTELVDE